VNREDLPRYRVRYRTSRRWEKLYYVFDSELKVRVDRHVTPSRDQAQTKADELNGHDGRKR